MAASLLLLLLLLQKLASYTALATVFISGEGRMIRRELTRARAKTCGENADAGAVEQAPVAQIEREGIERLQKK